MERSDCFVCSRRVCESPLHIGALHAAPAASFLVLLARSLTHSLTLTHSLPHYRRSYSQLFGLAAVEYHLISDASNIYICYIAVGAAAGGAFYVWRKLVRFGCAQP
jgi:hypothetical protein